jgi:myo-inositol-1-phosphate synthase
MTDKDRLVSKKKSKENVITSQNDLQNVTTTPRSVHAGPSDYIPYMKDNKVAHIRIEAEGFAGVPLTLDCRLSVQDSPNSAGVVIDAIRYLKVAVNKGMTGPLNGVSAFTQKTPPIQMTLAESYKECQELAKGV